MASKARKLFEKALTNEEVTDLIESMIVRIKQYEDNNQIMINGCQATVELFNMQQEELTSIQAQLTLRDYEVDLLTKRVISLEEANVKKGCENCKCSSTTKWEDNL